ncbi:MAG: hypothetical protein ABIZ04_04335 [Opitutus sp.]
MRASPDRIQNEAAFAWWRCASRLQLAVIVTAMAIAMGGCSTPGAYSRIPARFTALPSAPNTESYLIETVDAVADPTATRYEFTFEGNEVTAQVSTISKTGARSERRRTGEIAAKLLKVFRAFNWSSIEAPPPDDDATVPPPNHTEVVLKARTAKSYREAQVRLADCAGLRKLLADLQAVK